MSREPGQTLRIAMSAYRGHDGRVAALFAAGAIGALKPDARDPCGESTGLGDALWLLRRLGLDLRRLSPASRRMLADAERRCLGCPFAEACGTLLERAGNAAPAPPAFCPNAPLFRQLQAEQAPGAG